MVAASHARLKTLLQASRKFGELAGLGCVCWMGRCECAQSHNITFSLPLSGCARTGWNYHVNVGSSAPRNVGLSAPRYVSLSEMCALVGWCNCGLAARTPPGQPPRTLRVASVHHTSLSSPSAILSCRLQVDSIQSAKFSPGLRGCPTSLGKDTPVKIPLFSSPHCAGMFTGSTGSNAWRSRAVHSSGFPRGV